MPKTVPSVPSVPLGLERNLEMFLRRVREAVVAAAANADEALDEVGGITQAPEDRATAATGLVIQEWQPNTEYETATIVWISLIAGVFYYISRWAHTSSANFTTDRDASPSPWRRLDLFPGQTLPWDSGTSYLIGDQVYVTRTFQGDDTKYFYISVEDHTSGGSFDADASKWRLLTFEGRSLFGYVAPGDSPQTGLGLDGDSFLATDGRWWVKVGTAWVYQGLIGKGLAPEGTPIHTGTAVPADTLGEVGDLYVETDDGDVWKKFRNGWSSTFIDILARTNGNLVVGTTDTPPSTVSGVTLVDGDAYLNTASGRYWKRDGGVWAAFGDLTGDELIASQVIYAYRSVLTGSQPPPTPVDGSFNFNTGVQVPPTDWVVTRPEQVDGRTVWRSLALAKSFPARLWEAAAGDWSTPVPATQALDSNVIYRLATSRPATPGTTDVATPIPTGWADDLSTLGKGLAWMSVGTLQVENLGTAGEGLKWLWRRPKILRDNQPGFGGKTVRMIYNHRYSLGGIVDTIESGVYPSGRWSLNITTSPGVYSHINLWNDVKQAIRLKLTVYDKDGNDFTDVLKSMVSEDIVGLWVSEDQWIDYRIVSVVDEGLEYSVTWNVALLEVKEPEGPADLPTGANGEVVFYLSRARPADTSVTASPPYQEITLKVGKRARIALPTESVGELPDDTIQETGDVQDDVITDALAVNIGGPYAIRPKSGITLVGHVSGGTPPYKYIWTPAPDAGSRNSITVGYYTAIRNKGTYTLRLYVEDAAGNNAADNTTVFVRDYADDIAANIIGPDTLREETDYTFTCAGLGRGGNPRFEWSIISGDASLQGVDYWGSALVRTDTLASDGSFEIRVRFSIGNRRTSARKTVTVLAVSDPPTTVTATPISTATPSDAPVLSPFMYKTGPESEDQAATVLFHRDGELISGVSLSAGLRDRNYEALRVVGVDPVSDDGEALALEFERVGLQTQQVRVTHVDSQAQARVRFNLVVDETSSMRGEWVRGVYYESHYGPTEIPTGYDADPRRESDGRVQQGDIVQVPWDIPLSDFGQKSVQRGYIPAMVRFQARERHLSTETNKPLITDDGPQQNQWWNPVSATDSAPQLPTDTGPFYWTPDSTIDEELPRAYGGNGVLTYSIVETLPSWLSFDASTRMLSGTAPSSEATAQTLTYQVLDEDSQRDREAFDYIIGMDPDAPGRGEDGFGLEWGFSVTAGPTPGGQIPAHRVYDGLATTVPPTDSTFVAGRAYDGFPGVTEDHPYGWVSTRPIVGSPNPGDWMGSIAWTPWSLHQHYGGNATWVESPNATVITMSIDGGLTWSPNYSNRVNAWTKDIIFHHEDETATVNVEAWVRSVTDQVSIDMTVTAGSGVTISPAGNAASFGFTADASVYIDRGVVTRTATWKGLDWTITVHAEELRSTPITSTAQVDLTGWATARTLTDPTSEGQATFWNDGQTQITSLTGSAMRRLERVRTFIPYDADGLQSRSFRNIVVGTPMMLETPLDFNPYNFIAYRVSRVRRLPSSSSLEILDLELSTYASSGYFDLSTNIPASLILSTSASPEDMGPAPGTDLVYPSTTYPFFYLVQNPTGPSAYRGWNGTAARSVSLVWRREDGVELTRAEFLIWPRTHYNIVSLRVTRADAGVTYAVTQGYATSDSNNLIDGRDNHPGTPVLQSNGFWHYDSEGHPQALSRTRTTSTGNITFRVEFYVNVTLDGVTYQPSAYGYNAYLEDNP